MFFDVLFGKIEGYLGILGRFFFDQMNGNDLEMIKAMWKNNGKYLKP